MGKQDMPSNYAKEMTETFETSEDDARKEWDEEIFNLLTELRTKLTESTTQIFPVKCPKCSSFKITVVFGTARRLECLSCGSEFRIEDK